MTHTPEPDPSISSVPADTTQHEAPEQREGTAPPETSTQQLRLTRSHNDRMIAGVCGGLAGATNIDPSLVRGILFVLVLFGGAGGLVWVRTRRWGGASSTMEPECSRAGRSVAQPGGKCRMARRYRTTCSPPDPAPLNPLATPRTNPRDRVQLSSAIDWTRCHRGAECVDTRASPDDASPRRDPGGI